MAAKTSLRRYGAKLRHCRSMCAARRSLLCLVSTARPGSTKLSRRVASASAVRVHRLGNRDLPRNLAIGEGVNRGCNNVFTFFYFGHVFTFFNVFFIFQKFFLFWKKRSQSSQRQAD